MERSTTLIHISDLHFHRVPRRPSQWFSQRFLGAANLVLRRAYQFPLERAVRLVHMLDGMDWDHLVITGDLTQLSLEEEFALARQTLEPLLARGPERITVVPGNHDRYVPDSQPHNGFEAYFGEFFGKGEIRTADLNDTWHLAAWDSAVVSPPMMAWGEVSQKTLKATSQWIKELPENSRVVLANHYPLEFKFPFRYVPSHDLREYRKVKQWLEKQPVDLYLHGHIHSNWILHKEDKGRTCTHVNSASSTAVPTRRQRSSFHRIIFQGEQFEVQPLAVD